MKKIALAIMMLACVSAHAVDLNGSTGYYGEIVSVAPGFYGQVGITLPSGTTCKGKSEVILRKDNTSFTQIYAALLSAVVAKSGVHLGPNIGNVVDTHGYCLVGEAAVGRFSAWSAQ